METETSVWGGVIVLAIIGLLVGVSIVKAKGRDTVIDERGRPEDRLAEARAEAAKKAKDGAGQ